MVVLRRVFTQFPLKLRLLIAFTNGFLFDMSRLGYFDLFGLLRLFNEMLMIRERHMEMRDYSLLATG